MTTSQKHQNNDSNQTRIALLEQSVININSTLIRLEKDIGHKFEKLENNLNLKFENIEKRLDKLDNRMWQLMLLIPGSVVGILIAKIFHLI